MSRERRQRGFTLLEMLVAVTLITVVIATVTNVYLDVTRSSNAATEHTRHIRRAVAILDRVARDLETAVLVRKPPELDPLAHPWLFYAESETRDEGASRFKFMSRGHVPRASAVHESDLEVVAYVLRPVEDGSFELLRWSSPRLPAELDVSFPRGEEDGALLLADGLASFGVRFMAEDGGWKDEWNSSTIVESSELPRAAEIHVALLPEDEESEPELLVRQVWIPMPPLDLQALLEGAEEAAEKKDDDEESEDCVTVNQCLARNPDLFDQALEMVPNLGAIGDDCFSQHSAQIPLTLENCQ